MFELCRTHHLLSSVFRLLPKKHFLAPDDLILSHSYLRSPSTDLEQKNSFFHLFSMLPMKANTTVDNRRQLASYACASQSSNVTPSVSESFIPIRIHYRRKRLFYQGIMSSMERHWQVEFCFMLLNPYFNADKCSFRIMVG